MINIIAKSAISHTAAIGVSLSLLLASNHTADAQSLAREKIDVIPTKVEISYTKGLKYLASIQADDGSFSKNGTRSQPAITGLCLLAFLGHGEDAQHGPYAKIIKKSIDNILKAQTPNGYIGTSMYNHGFATLALAEAYGMIEDERLAGALKKAVALLISSQDRNPKGSWRYRPEDKTGDTSIAGCQIVALLAARNAGIPVPDKNIDKALKYMATCRATDGGYGYTSPGGARTTLTAIGSLCMSLAKKKDDKAFDLVTQKLIKPAASGHVYLYYHQYYMAQALFHADEEAWKEWNKKNSEVMTSSQSPEGSWNDSRLGKSGATGFALLSMALNYRFLPIYEK